MTTITDDALKNAYATFDFSVYSPLTTSAQSITATARLLARLTPKPLPVGLLEVGAFRRTPDGWERGEILDDYRASITFFNAITDLYRRMQREPDSELYNHLQTIKKNPFQLFTNAIPTIESLTQILGALQVHIETSSDARVREVIGDRSKFQESWDRAVRELQRRFKDLPDIEQDSNPYVSPLGVMQRYRQHYIYNEVCAGPLEVVQTLAPGEQLEVVLVESDSSSREEELENETQLESTSSKDTKNTTELTDRVANSLSRSSTIVATASGAANAVIWSGSGSVTATSSISSQANSEHALKQVNEVVQKQTDQIKKRTKVTTRVVETRSTTTTTRHVVQNKSDVSANYGLRRLGYDVCVKVEDLGPQLVWQHFVTEPGKNLRISEIVELRPDIPEYDIDDVDFVVEVGGLGPGFDSATIDYADALKTAAAAHIARDLDDLERQWLADDKLVQSHIESTMVLEDFGSYDHPNVRNTSSQYPKRRSDFQDGRTLCAQLGPGAPATTHWGGFNVRIKIKVKKRRGAVKSSAAGTPAPSTVVEQLKTRIAEEIKIESRKRNDLEYEERKALLSLVLENLLSSYSRVPGEDEIQATYLIVNDIFDLRQMFFDIDVAEWSTIKHSVNTGTGKRDTYLITSNTTKFAPLGSSLGWTHQLDGDAKRDIFLNAPWALVGIPIKPGKELAALNFLRARTGLSNVDLAMDNFVRQFERLRLAERKVASAGLKSRTAKVSKDEPVDSSPRRWLENPEIPSDLKWRDVYPIVSEQYVFQYVQGFVTDTIKVGDAWSDEGKGRLKSTAGSSRARKLPRWCKWF